MQILPDEKLGCHRTGFTKKCRSLVSKGICGRWLQIQGANPQTGESVNHYDCIDNWGPFLQLEAALIQRQTSAAIESFRNEMVLINVDSQRAIADAQSRERKLINGDQRD